MNFWKVTFTDGSYGYIEALNFPEAVGKIGQQDWCQEDSFIEKMEIVDNGFGPDIVDGWYSRGK